MALRFMGIDPNTGGEGSPTMWVEEESADLVLQGIKAEQALEALVSGTEWEDPAVVKLCASAFEAVWERAVDHETFTV
ncbi:DUF6879 family protein [Streptomyces pathocidini]|uniref:DUF6879 family protein n=1 Tax=Streptomyces pathocidini TaxID=1650571 RepID=A0ABW7UUY8_9ACTN|nr:DUF6879 family protein [Streptomyces pathocidini]